MNYIKRLERENATLRAALATAETGLVSLRAYVESDKFSTDPTVQVRDIDLRVREIQSAVHDAYMGD